MQVFFLLGFVAYFVVALVALVLDAEAMDEECAVQSWIWLYVLLVLIIPTTIGFIIGLLQAALQMVFKDESSLRMVDMFLSVPAPLLMVTLGVIGLALWGGMADECFDMYWENYAMLVVVFFIQVCLMCVSALFGILALCAMGIGLINSATKNAGAYINIGGSGSGAETDANVQKSV